MFGASVSKPYYASLEGRNSYALRVCLAPRLLEMGTAFLENLGIVVGTQSVDMYQLYASVMRHCTVQLPQEGGNQ